MLVLWRGYALAYLCCDSIVCMAFTRGSVPYHRVRWFAIYAVLGALALAAVQSAMETW